MFLSKLNNGIWYIYYNNSTGKRKKISTKTKFKREALQYLSEFESNIKRQKELKVIPIDLISFKNSYLKHSEAVHRPKTTKALKTIFESLISFCGNPYLSTISTIELKKFLEQKYTVSPYTAQKYLAFIRSAFNDAVKDGYLEQNPFNKIDNFRLPEQQPLFFSESEFQSLLSIIEDKDLKDLIIFGVNTSMRQMEMLTLKWNQINFKERFLTLDNISNITKSGKIGTVPLNLTALQILTERERTKINDNVFNYKNEPIGQDFISKKFKKFVIKAKLNKKFKFHTLRHTGVSWILQRGGSMLNVSKILRHSDIKVTQIYSHIRPEDLLKSVELLDN
jgi:integrase